MQDFIDKFRANAKRASIVQSRIKAVEKMDAEAPADVTVEALWNFSIENPEPLGRPVISINDIFFDYPSNVEKAAKGDTSAYLLRDVNFGIDLSSKIGVLGPNGAVSSEEGGGRGKGEREGGEGWGILGEELGICLSNLLSFLLLPLLPPFPPFLPPPFALGKIHSPQCDHGKAGPSQGHRQQERPAPHSLFHAALGGQVRHAARRGREPSPALRESHRPGDALVGRQVPDSRERRSQAHDDAERRAKVASSVRGSLLREASRHRDGRAHEPPGHGVHRRSRRRHQQLQRRSRGSQPRPILHLQDVRGALGGGRRQGDEVQRRLRELQEAHAREDSEEGRRLRQTIKHHQQHMKGGKAKVKEMLRSLFQIVRGFLDRIVTRCSPKSSLWIRPVKRGFNGWR